VLGTLEGGGGGRGGGGRLEVIDTRKVQSRKPVTQIKVLEDKQLMLCLTDAAVCVYSLPHFELQGQLTRSKGCNLFDWDESRGMLCVATKRRLLLYHHDGSDFVELKDIPVNDTVRCLAWCGDAICLGFKKEYVLVNASTGVSTEVFPTGRSSMPNILPVPPPATPGPGGFGGVGGGGGAEELLLARDNVGIFVGADGKPTRKHGLPWTETPTATVGFPPYAVAALPNNFEVRNLQRGSQHGLAQTLPLKGVVGIVVISAADRGGGRGGGQQSPSSEGGDVVLYAFTSNSVVRLRGVPIPSQVGQLLDAGQFEAALLLCDLLVHAPSLRAELTETAHLRCAYERFHEGAYDDAMRHFGAGGASPLEVLALFPGILPPALGAVVARHQSRLPNSMRPPPPTSADGVSSSKEALSALLPLLLGTRSRLRDASSSSWGVEDEEAAALDTAALRAMVATDAPREAVLELLEPPTAVHPAAGERALVDAGRHPELVALHRAAGQHRRALELLQRIATTTTSGTSGRGSASSRSTFGPDDTVAYMRAMKPSDPLLTLEFSRWVLREQPGEETLELFTTADPPLPAEDVLPHLRMHAAQLCIPYLEHEVAARGTELPVEFHNDLVLLYLAELTRAKAAAAGGDARKEETSMADVRRRLLNLLRAPAATSRYNPERMLSRFPQDAFFEERAVLLGRVGRHEEALSILVRRLNNPRLAEAYCDRVWSQAHPTTGPGGRNGGGGVLGELDEWLAVNDDAADMIRDDAAGEGGGGVDGVAAAADINVYHSLLGIYLEEPTRDYKRTSSSSSSEGWLKEALGLLTRRHQCIDGKKAVELLPDDVPLQDVMPFLEAKMRSSAQLKHKLEMHKSLLQSQHDEAEEEIRKFKSRSFVVTEEAMCAICHKRIGTSVFGVHPDGSLVHYNCLNR
jgi:hypothetical protein